MAARRRLPGVSSGSDEEADDAERESALQELSNAVMREVSLEHAVVYDCYNICELISSSRLSSFSVQMLKEFCNFFENRHMPCKGETKEAILGSFGCF